jgi:hypothetical protein
MENIKASIIIIATINIPVKGLLDFLFTPDLSD